MFFESLMSLSAQAFSSDSDLICSDNSFENSAGRANMTPETFKSFVEDNNMEIISQNPINFKPLNSWDGTDCISFFKKKD
jgi:hypothetical protein